MKTQEIGAFEAKTHLSDLLDKVRHGACYVITLRGKPVAELRPVEEPKKKFYFGCDKGKIFIADDFDAPLEDFKEYME